MLTGTSDMIKLYFTNKKLYNNIPFLTNNVTNPLDSIDTCILHNTKKQSLYTHTYNPTVYIKELKELGITDEILSKFDNQSNDNCCKVIAISLYFPKCKIDNIEKYLFSIYRTVKNVEKKLNDWIVRLYFDMTVYNCVLNISTEIKHESVLDNDVGVNTHDDTDVKVNDDIKRTFEYIINSPNVELYTYECNNTNISLEKTRTLRFLPLSDPEVALCVVREADGIVSNLDCQNIKLFDESKKLFYLSHFSSPFRIRSFEGKNYVTYKKHESYGRWLNLYKQLIERNYFASHQNLYDLLAGLFSIKLRFNRQKYIDCIHNLTNKMNKLFEDVKSTQENRNYVNHSVIWETSNTSGICTHGEENRDIREPYNEHTVIFFKCIFDLINTIDINELNLLFNFGFDEILLLDFLKEIISTKHSFPYFVMSEQNEEYVNYDKRTKLFFQHNITKIEIDADIDLNSFKSISDKLQPSQLISDGKLNILIEKINNFFSNYVPIRKYGYLCKESHVISLIDTLFTYITIDKPLVITYRGGTSNNLLNRPYKLMYDEYYELI